MPNGRFSRRRPVRSELTIEVRLIVLRRRSLHYTEGDSLCGRALLGGNAVLKGLLSLDGQWCLKNGPFPIDSKNAWAATKIGRRGLAVWRKGKPEQLDGELNGLYFVTGNFRSWNVRNQNDSHPDQIAAIAKLRESSAGSRRHTQALNVCLFQ